MAPPVLKVALTGLYEPVRATEWRGGD